MNEKLIVTVGPSSYRKDIIQKMDSSGVDVFRINLSHVSIGSMEEMIHNLYSWTAKPICLDTEGAQIRTGIINGGNVRFVNNQEIEIVPQSKNIKSYQLPIANELHIGYIQPGDLLHIDFNSVITQVTAKSDSSLRARVIQGGIVGSNKGISIDREVFLPAFSKKDMEAFSIAAKNNLNCIAFSFAASERDIKELRCFFDYPITVISKIESYLGLKNLQSICSESDAVLIDRGDLSREIPLEKIPFAQSYIIKKAKEASKPVYVATNLMENMIKESKPTRAEVNDIVSIMNEKADGLVLAAESAIGNYPVECVRMVRKIINEYNQKIYFHDLESLRSVSCYRIVEPHGGNLIQQFYHKSLSDLNELYSLEIDNGVQLDINQIAEGTYSPIDRFMCIEEMQTVLEHNKLLNGVSWTLPIIYQLHERQIKEIPLNQEITLRSGKEDVYAIMFIDKVEKIHDMKTVARNWFGTDNEKHPGVSHFYSKGNYVVSGKPFLLHNRKMQNEFILTPNQTRTIFNDLNWHNIVGFHTRNIPHRAHEKIQIVAMEKANADGLFLSPVVGYKKKGDFQGWVIIKCYEELIKNGYYNPYGTLLSGFNTYSRYSGPREAVFTALCRKNFGCNYFIIGRDHTGVGNFYDSNASIDIFEEVDTGITILPFETAYYCNECQDISLQCAHSVDKREEISGSIIRDSLKKNMPLDERFLRKEVMNVLLELFKKYGESIFA